MKFTDGYWQVRPGVEATYASQVYDIVPDPAAGSLTVYAPARAVTRRGSTINDPLFSVTLTAPMPGVIGVRIEHFAGATPRRGFDIADNAGEHAVVSSTDEGATLTSGDLVARVVRGQPWNLSFEAEGRVLTASGAKSVGYMELGPGAQVDQGIVDRARGDGSEPPRFYLHEQLALGVGEFVYGLGERFGPVVKNGQRVDIWNADGGTASEQAYKNAPFYLTNRGYGVLVNDSGHVSYEIGSEAVERVQFSVPGERLEYFVIHGADPKQVLQRYTALTGRPAAVPAWSYGLWLSTSFTTDYDEATVNRFIDGMAERDIPLSVFHFDCFWMREFNWCDFQWDPRVFPDPEGMLARLHEKDLRICVWINPYIGQRSPLFAEAKAAGYLVCKPDGSVWQSDLWQAGMGLVDFTNPDATAWYQGKLQALLDQGVDCFKTDFGERIPLNVIYADGSDPGGMHNYYTQLYNQAVFDVLTKCRGEGDAVTFARSATVGGQQFPVHWGGDSNSTYESMAETLRGGISLALSGFGFWSHDIGGFEGTPDPGVFKRWIAFGLLSSHSRLHGSNSYRVPWLFDDDEADPHSAVSVTRKFARLKLRLMPYLYAAGQEAHEQGIPVLRPMQLEFPDDPAVAYLDRQYMLGPDLLVAPVFSPIGVVQFYLPAGEWTNYLTGETVTGGSWRTETHGFDSLPLYVREGAVLATGARDDRPDYDYLDGLTLVRYPGGSGRTVTVVTPTGRQAQFTVDGVGASSDIPDGWGIRTPKGDRVAAVEGKAQF